MDLVTRVKSDLEDNLSFIRDFTSYIRFDFMYQDNTPFHHGGLCGIHSAVVDYVLRRKGYDVEHVLTPHKDYKTTFCNNDYTEHEYLRINEADEILIDTSHLQFFYFSGIDMDKLNPILITRYKDLNQTLESVFESIKNSEINHKNSQLANFKIKPNEELLSHYCQIWDYKAKTYDDENNFSIIKSKSPFFGLNNLTKKKIEYFLMNIERPN